MSDKQHEENERTGSIAGLGAGTIVGAGIGSAILPVVGTFAGALVGGLLGSQVGKNVGGAILDTFTGGESAGAPATASTETEDVLMQLEKLSQLRDKGILTEEEFAAAKAKLLGM
ncbi:MAG: hypothetical protein GFH27_549293n66 [Chloroflexi bacterium AL-W]|nr:Membrane protease subunit, stomatin/prohibitin family, contains C-terminal Zn-ribbon domain [Chloroflexi bacterium AL-N1]NOK67819.1 hypothetical protein [Chloroflexi bacterium AL-N10]NOK75411.1 hypothetical protein [Chloroflexi bacterium AL-N5]NOK82199.1 hypothetical protein [Chloroflexi bacterium AL-W]NOK90044.1 hypothetical protein [Chloroflexi bacterium AL-N15]